MDTTTFCDTPRLTLTPEGLVLLAEAGLLPRFSEAEVRDRSQADVIAKLLVCSQTLWFLIQSFARIAEHLPLTLLEVHTMTHIACAFGMYAIWFNKGYNITNPIVWDDERIVNMVAFLVLRADDTTCDSLNTIFYGAWDKYEEVYDDPDSYEDESCAPRGIGNHECSMHHDITIESIRGYNKGPVQSPKIFNHLEAANSAIAYLRASGLHFHWTRDSSDMIEYHRGHVFVVHTHYNWFIKGCFDSDSKYKPPKGIKRNATLLFSALYGAAHMSAWRFSFPTFVEMWMWRAACLSMIVNPVLFALLLLMRDTDEIVSRRGSRMSPEKGGVRGVRKCTGSFLRFLMVVDGLCFLCTLYTLLGSRAFLLVESLVSLRKPVSGTYNRVDWAYFIPHSI